MRTSWARGAMAAIVGALLASGCGHGGSQQGDASGDGGASGADGGDDRAAIPDGQGDAGSEGAGDGGPPGWLDRTVLETTPAVFERVAYASEGLRVGGELCRPTTGGPHPVIVWLHGGFAGIGSGDRAFCKAAAGNGYVVAVPSYRGEDGGEGKVEVCLGEVADAQAMIAVLRTQPYVAASRFAAFGASHGGCIALELGLREPTLRAVVDYFGPSDWGTLFDWWVAQKGGGEPFCTATGQDPVLCATVHTMLIDQLRASTGGSPGDLPAAYLARSPAARLGGLKVPTIILHGTDDYFVALDQSCEKRMALTAGGHDVAAWFFDAALATLPAGDARLATCGGFHADALPAKLDRDFYWLVYQGQGHGFTAPAADAAGGLALQFIVDRL